MRAVDTFSLMESVPVPKSIQMRTLRTAAIAAMAFVVVALVFDRWYKATLTARERERVIAYASPYANALESSINQRLSRLNGLKVLIESRGDPADVEIEFQRYADALSAGIKGMRGAQLVRGGRIVATNPASDSLRFNGYNLFADSRSAIAEDLRRAISTGQPTVTGPIELLNGGSGIVIRQSLSRPEPDAPDNVSLVVDVPTVINEARGIAKVPANTLTSVRDRANNVIDGAKDLDDPIKVAIDLPDGNWTLLAAPSEGWGSLAASDMLPTRLASIMIVILLTWLTYAQVGRQERLTEAVLARTSDLQGANRQLTREVEVRQAAEERLRANDERLRLAVKSGHMGTWEYDPRAMMMHWSGNARAILGAASEEFAEPLPSLRLSVSHELHHAIVTTISAADATPRGEEAIECRAEFRYTTPAGAERWLYASGELHESARAGGARLVGVLVDVTARKQLEEQLLQSQKMEAVGTLAGGIAHDFNNLLTAILGFAQLSQMQASALNVDGNSPALRTGLEELRVDLDEIVKAGERASLLTGQLLAFSRRQVHKPTRVDINGVVHEVERMLVRLIGERIRLETHTSSDPLPVVADPGQISQVIVNLVVNARDALPSGGVVNLNTQRLVVIDPADAPFAGLGAGTWVVVEVKDNGMGMTPEVMARMFEPFFTTKRLGEGTGLGLSTVYGIVTQGGGRVFVHSTLGVGTSVHVALPMHHAAEGAAVAADVVVPLKPSSARVLVVEDEPGLRRLVAEILTRRGYTVEVASDGVEALATLAAADTPPDLVLSDVVMPRLGGRALADEIARRGMTMPVLFMSGYPAGEELPEDNAHTFIGKPFTPDALVRKVRFLLERVENRA